MLSLTFSDTDTFDFLSSAVKCGKVDLPDLLRQAIGDAFMPDTDWERHKERGAAEHEDVERPDISQLLCPVCATDEINLVGDLPQNTLYFIIAGVTGIAQANREGR